MKTNPRSLLLIRSKKSCPNPLGLLLFLTLPFGSLLIAQDETEEEIVTLNPFIVQEEPGTWSASQTLAGSRLKSDLSDVASQVEVMTMEFMEAFDLNSIDEAAIYSLNVEAPEENVGQGISGFANDTLRIRGISGGTRSREFFATGIPTDNYNLTRVDIASGPNAILFGTGSAAGSINSTLSRASVHNTFGEVGLEVDTFGGLRAELDYNLAINDKLALRVAGVADHDAFDPDESYQRIDRSYATVTWKPTERITLSGHAEFYDRYDKRPARTVPYDSFRMFFESGDLLERAQLVDPNNPTIPNGTIFDNSLDWLNNQNRDLAGNEEIVYDTERPQITVIGGSPTGRLSTPRSWYNSVNPNQIAPGELGLYEEVNLSNNGISTLSDEYIDRNFNTAANLRAKEDTGHILNFFYNQELLKNLFLDAGMAYEKNDSLDTEVMQFNHAQTVHADPNRFLPGGIDGTEANPRAGEMYLDGRSGYDRGDSENLEWRVAASYDFDVRGWTENKWINWLGRHRVAAMYLDRRQENMNQRYRYYLQPQMINGQFRDGNWEGYPYNELDTRYAIGGLGVPGVNGDEQSQSIAFDDGGRELWVRSYIGTPGQLTYPEGPQGFSPSQAYTLVDRDGIEWNIDPENSAVATNGQRLTTGSRPNGLKQFLKTKQLSWQGFLWNDRIVTTLGWREDTLNSAEESVVSDLMWQHPETGAMHGAQGIGFNPHWDTATYLPYEDEREASGDTEYRGFVVHPFRNWGNFSLPLGADLSLSYSESNTFQPNTTERNVDGNLIPGEQGDGEDFGVTLSLFERSLTIRYNKYETIAGPTKLFLPFRRYRFRWRASAMRDVMKNLVDQDKAIFDMYFPNPEDWPLRTRPETDQDNLYPFGVRDGGFATGNFENYADPYTFTADTNAEGHELSVSWQPNRNLSLRVTWNDQEVIQSEVGKLWFQFEDEFERIMDRTKFIEGYVPGANNGQGDDPNGKDLDGLDLDPNDGLPPGIDYFTWEDIPFGGGSGNPMTRPNLAWGQHNGAVDGGWGRPTMKERWLATVVNSNIGSSVLKAFDGQPNDFLRNNRINANIQYRFNEGRLNGLRIGGAMRWRAGAGNGVGVQVVNGVEVPDTSIIMKGPDSLFFDLSFRYRSEGDLFGLLGKDYRYNVGLTVRNVLDEGPYEPTSTDFYTGETTGYIRVPGRQFIFSSGLEF